MWIEFEERITDITSCMAQPPNFPGKLVIDGQPRGPGGTTLYSKEIPSDGVEVDIHRPDKVGEHARRERADFLKLAGAGMAEALEYLNSAPSDQQLARKMAWLSFAP